MKWSTVSNSFDALVEGVEADGVEGSLLQQLHVLVQVLRRLNAAEAALLKENVQVHHLTSIGKHSSGFRRDRHAEPLPRSVPEQLVGLVQLPCLG